MLYCNIIVETSRFFWNMKRHSRCPFMLLIYLLISLICQVGSSLEDIIVVFAPPQLLELKSGESKAVVITMMTNRENGVLDSVTGSNTSLLLELEMHDPERAKIQLTPAETDMLLPWHTSASANYGLGNDMNKASSVSIFEIAYLPERLHGSKVFLNTSVTISGLFLGRTQLAVMAWKHTSNSKNAEKVPLLRAPQTYNIKVLDGNGTLNHIFIGVLTILIIVANLLMGSQLNLAVIWAVLKRPVSPFIGFLCQFILMPLISYGLAMAFLFPVGYSSLALGLFTVGCSPGGGASNFWTVLLGGNVDLSVTMTFLSTAFALATMPLWMFTLGRQFMLADSFVSTSDLAQYAANMSSSTNSHLIKIPYKSITISLLTLILPILVGIAIRRFKESWAAVAKTVLRPFIIVIVVFICTFGVYANLYMFRLMTWRVLLCGLLLPWTGFFIGWLLSQVFRQPHPNAVAISIETGIQNAGIAIMLLKSSFPAPDGDMASVVPVVVSIFTPVPLLIAFGVGSALKCMLAPTKPYSETESGDVEKVVATTTESLLKPSASGDTTCEEWLAKDTVDV